MPPARSNPAPAKALSALLRQLAEEQRGPAGEALLRAAADVDLLPAARRPSPAASVQERLEAELLAVQLEQGIWHAGALGLPWHNLDMLRALDPPTARRLFATALAQWPAAAAAELAGQRPLEPLREALVQLTVLLLWQLQAADEEPSTGIRVSDIERPRPSSDREEEARAGALAERYRKAAEAAAIRSMMGEPKKVWVGKQVNAGLGDPVKNNGAPKRGAAQAVEPSPARPRRTRSATALDPHAAAPAPAPQPACFHFVLQGDHAQGEQMREHTEADLHFRFDAPPVDALATVQHDALDAARAQDLDVALQLTPCGAVAIVGERRATVQLRGGRIAVPVQFRLQALAAPVGQAALEDHGVHVQFVVRGETVHQQMLGIQVQPAQRRSRSAAPAQAEAQAAPVAGPTVGLLAAAAHASPPARHSLRLSLSVDGASLRMELDHHVDGELWWSGDATSQAYDAAGVAALAMRARSELADCYSQQVAFWRRFDGTLATDDPTDGLQYALWCAAAAGATLNQELRQDAGIAALLDVIEQVPDGAVLTITTDRVFLPWELLTPQKWGKRWTQAQRDKQPLDVHRFWGARFAIETTPRRLPVGERALTHLRAKPRRISVNVNPDIQIDGLDDARQPQQLHQQWAARLAQASTLDGALNATCDPMREVLQNAQHQASLIYLYCHGQSAQPFGGSDERLVLDEGCPLAPGDLAGDADYRAAPLVFLNACDSGMPSPMAFASFLREFCQRGAVGLIATTNAVPISFAAHFGPQLVDRYLQCEGPLSEMLRQLRRAHLAQGNPVALFYTLQCKLNFPRAAAIAHPPAALP